MSQQEGDFFRGSIQHMVGLPRSLKRVLATISFTIKALEVSMALIRQTALSILRRASPSCFFGRYNLPSASGPRRASTRIMRRSSEWEKGQANNA